MRRIALFAALAFAGPVLADGKVFKPRDYQGSLEEQAQEAILIFHASDEPEGGHEDLILKIGVKGGADRFAWVVPFPGEPKVEKEDSRLFKELYNYVELRRAQRDRNKDKAGAKAAPGRADDTKPVDVLSRQVVGSYDVAVVRENKAGALDRWLKAEGYQPLGDDAEDVLGFYRKKGYVFACLKVQDAGLSEKKEVDLHPLRFSFRTGVADGMYFPMRLTGLQEDPFDVNLYVFYRYWIDDRLSEKGYTHRGFHLRYRDWDGPKCEPDGGKAYDAPEGDPFLGPYSNRFPTVTRLLQKLHPGERYYLTNIQARGLRPADVRAWPDDLWLHPYYVRRGPAAWGWETWAAGGLGVVVVVGGLWWWRRRAVVPDA